MTAHPHRLPVSPSAKREALERFARAVVAHGFNYARAFRDVFPNTNISGQAVTKNAYKLSQNANVQGILRRIRANDDEHISAVQEKLRSELSALAFSRIGDAVDVDDDGEISVRNPKAMDDATAAAVQEVDVIETESARGLKTRRTKVKLVPKNEAVRNLMDHYGLRREPEPTPIEFDVKVVNVATIQTETHQHYAETVQGQQARDASRERRAES